MLVTKARINPMQIELVVANYNLYKYNQTDTFSRSIFLNNYQNGIISIKIGDRMVDKVINDFYFSRLFYIVIVTLIGLAVINDLKSKDKINIKECLNLRKFNVSILLKYMFLSFIIRILLEQLVTFIPISTTDVQIPSNVFEIIAEIVTTCIFAPIFEEIIFRFGLYKKLNKKLNIFISIMLTSIVFALIHIYNIDGFIILLGISLIWNYSFYKTNNLVYPIALHLIHNLYAVSDNLLNYSNYWYILLIISVIGYIITIIKKQKN